MQNTTMFIEQAQGGIIESGNIYDKSDDDGRLKRTGTFVTATAHIITAVIGSGVLSLAWAVAQLGWVAGPTILITFSLITYYMSTLQADCYRSPTGGRNYKYMDVVQSYLGGSKVQLCGIAQYANLVGISIGYTITTSISMVALKRSSCYQKHGYDADCSVAHYPFMILFAVMQVVLSQIPNFHKLAWLSILASIMSFGYASIGLGFSIAKLAGHSHVRTTLTGVTIGIDVTSAQKAWRSFQAIGNIALAYSFSNILVEIQDTISQRSPPSESKVMKRAALVGISVTSVFYILCGCIGYAAFGNEAPGNFLNGFKNFGPFWLIDLAHACVTVHLICAYQVFGQPLFGFVEGQLWLRFPENKFLKREHALNIPFYGTCYINLFRLVWRSLYVILTSFIAMIFPFFNDFMGLLGAANFYPLTVYFPIEMHIKQAQISKFSPRWIVLNIISWVCLCVSLVAAIGSIQGLYSNLKAYKPFEVHE